MGIGLWARYENTKAGASVNKITDWDLDPAWLLIAIGFLMFNLGFCGCIGALRENIALLKFVGIFLFCARSFSIALIKQNNQQLCIYF